MALMQLETYTAHLAAGCPEAEARAAAQSAADIDVRHSVMAERLNGIDSKLNVVIGVMLVGFGSMLAGFWQILLRLPR